MSFLVPDFKHCVRNTLNFMTIPTHMFPQSCSFDLFIAQSAQAASFVNATVSNAAVHPQPLFTLFYFLAFQTQATWLRTNKGTSPVLERLWLEKITAHGRDQRENPPPSDCSGLTSKRGAQPSGQPCDHAQRQQSTKDSDKPTHTQKRSGKSLQTALSQIFFRKFQPVPHTPSLFSFLSPHPSPLLSQPSRFLKYGLAPFVTDNSSTFSFQLSVAQTTSWYSPTSPRRSLFKLDFMSSTSTGSLVCWRGSSSNTARQASHAGVRSFDCWTYRACNREVVCTSSQTVFVSTVSGECVYCDAVWASKWMTRSTMTTRPLFVLTRFHQRDPVFNLSTCR